ncbi:hypothetical protein K1719_020375 [Acacia pycnantha]|nr:hypothetical protein K1719_020375 [Acacia pycnantha]
MMMEYNRKKTPEKCWMAESGSNNGGGSAAEIMLAKKKKEEMQQQKRGIEGLHLLTLLLHCAEAVGVDNFDEANKMLLEISQLPTPFGTSAQRVAAYFLEEKMTVQAQL